MQDFVGVRVADSAEQVRIGERAFQRVVVLAQRPLERRKVRIENFDPARIVIRERGPSLHDEQRRLSFGAGLGEQQRAVLEVEREQANLSRNLRTARLPAESTRNHQMEDEKQLALGLHHHTLAEAVKVHDRASLNGRERRIDGSQQERRRQPHMPRRGADHTRTAAREIEQDVGGARALPPGSYQPATL
jgi:hypothetical protein